MSYGFVNYNPQNLGNYAWYGVQGPYQEPTTDKIWNFKVDAQRSLSLGWLNSLGLGANYEDRPRQHAQLGRQYGNGFRLQS